MDEKKNIQEVIRRARLVHGWTQKDLANLLGIAESTVRSWERGHRLPGPKLLAPLSRLLEMSPADLDLLLSRSRSAEPIPESESEPEGMKEPQQPMVSEGEVMEVVHRSEQRSEYRPLVWFHQRGDENRYRMLRRVHARWISRVLDPLSSTPLIPLNLQMRLDAVEGPWLKQTQEPFAEVETIALPAGTSILDVYDDADGELLILGAPGAGKTTLLLELLRSLIERARLDESHPIPVIFNLSSWAERQGDLEDWLVEELNLMYQVPISLAQAWIAHDQIHPLLDGLDEVESRVRTGCVDVISRYRHDHGLVPIVVCCRSEDYEALGKRLLLGKAVEIQPLTTRQIDEYIAREANLEEVRTALQTDHSLQELVSTPLMLRILAYTYSSQNMSPEEMHALRSSRYIMLEQYVERLLLRENQYTPIQTKYWLSWLAWEMTQHNLAEFYVERMQPDWIENSQQRHHYQRAVIRIIMSIQCIIGGALFAWLKGGLKNGIVGSGNGILGLFGGGPGNSMMGWMAPGIGGGSQGGASLVIILGIVFWLVTILVGSPSLPSLTPKSIRYGLFSGLRSGLKFGLISSALAIPFFWMLGGMQHGISYGLGVGFFLGILAGLMRGLGTGLRYDEELKKSKKATEIVSLKDRVIDGIVLGAGGGIGFFIVEELLQVSQQSTMIYSLVVFFFYFFAYGFGGGTSLFTNLAQTIKPTEKVTWSWVQMTQDMRENGRRSLLIALVTCLSVGTVVACLSSFFFLDITYGLHYGLVFGTICGLIVGTAAILVSMITSGWSSTILPEEQHIRPNEGISRSGRNALIGACVFAPLGAIASGIACGIGFGLVGGLLTWPVMAKAFAVMFAITFFSIFATAQGGNAWIEHYTLRGYLWRTGAMPLDYVHFLNAASDYALLRRVGGGYMFTHRLVLEHFAHQYQVAQAAIKKRP